MGSNRSANPVKHFASIVVPDPSLLAAVKDRLEALYGRIDHESLLIDRAFLSFERLIDAADLAAIKRQTKAVADELDHGYLDNTMVHFKDTAVHLSARGEPQAFFRHAQQIYRSQLKTMCILNRKEPH